MDFTLPTKEDAIVEFKTSFTDEVVVALVAFANTKGGTVYVGVDDRGAVSGVQLGKETTAQWLNTIKVKTTPALIPRVETFDFDGKTVVTLHIPEYPIKPVAIKGRYYKRIENSNHLLDTVEITNMNLQSLQTSWDSYPKNGATINDIDLSKVSKFIEKVNAKGRFELDNEPIAALRKLKLLNSNGEVTNAAYLLFTHERIDYNVHIGRFKTPSLIIDDRMISLSLFDTVEQTMKFIKSHLKVAFEITGQTTSRNEIFEYPLAAIREIVLNSIIHRSYTSPIDIQIKIFDNKITFYNPGSLYGGLKVEDLKTDYYQAQTRNRMIAEAFYLTGDIEKYGSGFIRIRKEVSTYPTMNFSFGDAPNGFMLTIEYQSQKINLNEPVNEPVNLLHKQIIELIKANKNINREELAKKTNVSLATIKRVLALLQQKGYISREGSDKTGVWKTNMFL